MRFIFSFFEKESINIVTLVTWLHQTSIVEEYIVSFKFVEVTIENFTNFNLKKCFISGVKEKIKSYVGMNHLLPSLSPLHLLVMHNLWHIPIRNVQTLFTQYNVGMFTGRVCLSLMARTTTMMVYWQQ